MNKVVLITGASSGIGKDLAEEFAKDKNDLVLIARSEEQLNVLASKLTSTYGVKIYCIKQDLAVEGASKNIIEQIEAKDLKVHTLVNNAGTQVYGKYQDIDIERELKMIQINLIALTELTKFSLIHMKELNGGNILNVGSTGSFAPGPYDAIYQATKAYVLFFTEGISADLKGTGIHVSILCPGATRTEFSKKAEMNDVFLFKYMSMSSKKVARSGFSGLKRKKRIIIPGLLNKLIVFSVRLMPRSFVLAFGGFLLRKL